MEVEAGAPHGLRRRRLESAGADRALGAGRMPMAAVAVGKLLLIQEGRTPKIVLILGGEVAVNFILFAYFYFFFT